MDEFAQTSLLQSTSALQYLLGNVPSERFLEQYNGREYLVIRGVSEKFTGLLKWTDLNSLLTYHAFDPSQVSVYRENRAISHEFFMHPGLRRPSKPALSAILRGGARLEIDNIDRMLPQLGNLAGGLERDMLLPVSIRLVLEYGHRSCLDPECQVLETIALQLDGETNWRLFERPQNHPLQPANFGMIPKGLDWVWEGTLRGGDFIYLPRGGAYAWRPNDGCSLYLAIRFSNPTRADVLKALVNEALKCEELRQDLPDRWRDSPPQPLAREIARTLDEIIEQRGDALTALRPQPLPARDVFCLETDITSSLSDEAGTLALQPSDARGISYQWMTEERLLLVNKTIALDGAAEPLLRYINEKAPVFLRDIVSRFDGVYEEQHLKECLSYLLQNNILTTRLDRSDDGRRETTCVYGRSS